MNRIGSIIFLLIFLGHSSTLIAGDFGQFLVTQGRPLSLQGENGYDPTGSNILDNPPQGLNYSRDTSPTGRLVFELPRFFPNLYVMTTPVEIDGGGNKHLIFSIDDEIFATDTDLDSRITLNEVDLALYYDIPFVKNITADMLNIDLGLNVRAVDIDGNIGHEQAVKASKHVVVPIPMVFGALQFHPLNALALEAEGRGISIGANKAFSLVGRIRWNVMDQVFAAGGYRFDKFDINYQGVLIDADISGPFFEAGLSF